MDVPYPILISGRGALAHTITTVWHNLRRMDDRGMHKIVFPVISFPGSSAQAYPYQLTGTDSHEVRKLWSLYGMGTRCSSSFP